MNTNLNLIVLLRPVERGGEGGKFSRAPRLGDPPSLKITENGVPDGFLVLSDLKYA